jgi:hypothetical protein
MDAVNNSRGDSEDLGVHRGAMGHRAGAVRGGVCPREMANAGIGRERAIAKERAEGP